MITAIVGNILKFLLNSFVYYKSFSFSYSLLNPIPKILKFINYIILTNKIIPNAYKIASFYDKKGV